MSVETEQKEKKIINNIVDRRKDAFTDLDLFFENARTSYLFYKSEQYEPGVKEALRKRGLPALVINIIKSNVNSLSGYERQNKTDIIVRPIEYTDDRVAEVLSRLIKWVFGVSIHKYVGSNVFKDEIIAGLGWWIVYMDYSKDSVNGDIKVKQGNLFDIVWDPQSKEPDLSDCRYIMYYCRVDKDDLKYRFSDYAEQIDRLEPGNRKNNNYQDPTATNKKETGLLVTEYWYRDYETRKFLINEDGDFELFEGNADEEAILSESGIDIVNKEVESIKLQIIVEDQVVVYDGENPFNLSMYPFVPAWGYYEQSFSEWHIKLQGEVQSLKDINIEKNKRRSQAAAVIAKSVHSGFFAEEQSVKNPNDLIKSGGAGKLIYVQRGAKPPVPIMPQEVPQSIIALEQMTSNDSFTVGVNPDVVGMMQEKGAPLGLSQLRAKQGIAQVQELFDNFSLSKTLVGMIMIELLTKNFDQDKIRRVLGADLPYEQKKVDFQNRIRQLEQFVPQTQQDQTQFYQEYQAIKIEMAQLEEDEAAFWSAWESVKENATYDCHIDESASSPTYRIAALSTLMSLIQGGADVPIEMIVELSDIPKSLKDRIIQSIQQKAQAQQSMIEEERAMKMQSEDMKNKIELLKAIAGMAGNEELTDKVLSS